MDHFLTPEIYLEIIKNALSVAFGLASLLAGKGLLSLFKTNAAVGKLQRDLNAAFKLIRELKDELSNRKDDRKDGNEVDDRNLHR